MQIYFTVYLDKEIRNLNSHAIARNNYCFNRDLGSSGFKFFKFCISFEYYIYIISLWYSNFLDLHIFIVLYFWLPES